jgi:hypothetical protein
MLVDQMSPRAAGLAAAMFVGIREDLQPEDFCVFYGTGAVHLLIGARFVTSLEMLGFARRRMLALRLTANRSFLIDLQIELIDSPTVGY